MNDLRTAAQKVVDAWSDPLGMKHLCEAMEALRAALAHQEPDLRNANPIGLTPPQKALQLAQFRADALAQQEAIERHRAIEAALKERNHE
jgi:hypothetical protein